MLHTYEFWFVVGSQFLYGPEVLETVAARAAEMADKLNASGNLPCKIVYKVTAKTNTEISDVVREANYDKHCAGIITWCHTFSPSKMWINGFANLQKPYCHFATQYNREIPNEEIDMDFMNLNQAAHGDREHGFIGARLRKPRKIIAGYWQDEDVQARIGSWMKAAIGVAVSKDMKVMRFGDNMRNVAVTEGDKVEVQKKLGWEVNTWAVGDLVREMKQVTEDEVDALMNLVYDVNGSLAKPLRDNSQEQLRQAMMMFAGGLESAAEMVYNGRDNTQMIDTALETVETYIRDYLGVPEEGERYDPFAHMDYGKGSKPSGAPSAEEANVEKPKSRMETEYVYDPPEALKASGYQPGALNERGERQRLSADTRERPMGAVPYGEVYGRYYAAYLSMIEDETFPQALREAAQAYMNGL